MIRRGCLALFAVLGLAAAVQADDAQIATLQKSADEAHAAQKAGEPAVQAARDQARQLGETVTTLKIEFSKAEATHADLVAKATAARDAFIKADDERKAALDAYVAARKAAVDAQGKENAAATQEAYLKAAEALAAKVTAAKTALDAVTPATDAAYAPQQVLAGHPAKIAAAEKAVADFQPQLQQAEAAYAALVKTALEHQIALETALVEAGKLVSFAKSVAPIFAQRCVACHNARTAKGRLNMETYANLMKGGESGEVVLAHKPDDSNLQMQIEAGEMPKEADPLTPEQMAVVKKWIETGARLDAGVLPTATLITIMPKPVQPAPPETYRVPVPVMAVAFSPDGNLIATSGYREVILWNAADGQLVRRISNLAERPHDIEFTADGAKLAVAAGTPGQLGEVKLFNVADGTLAADLFTTDDEVFSVAISPDGTRIAATCADRSVRVHDLATNQRLLFIEDHADWVMDAAWSPDGSKLATASRDKTAKVFDAKTGDALATFNSHGQPVFGVGFLPDGNQVVSGGLDNRLRVWNVADAKQAREIGGFGGTVFRLVVTPDGHVLSASADKQIRLHTLADGKQVRAFAGHNEWVYAVAPHLASKRIVSGSHDGEIRVWNYEDGKTTLNFLAAPGYKPQVAAAP
jgi:DNA-binding beta-propeller fold protein YncE